MSLKRLKKDIEKLRDEWSNLLEEQGDDWEQAERQEGEIDALDTVLSLIDSYEN